ISAFTTALRLRNIQWPHIGRHMSVHSLSTALTGFIEPCLPSRTPHPPLGPGWLHEIKYDGFRLMERRAVACDYSRGVATTGRNVRNIRFLNSLGLATGVDTAQELRARGLDQPHGPA